MRWGEHNTVVLLTLCGRTGRCMRNAAPRLCRFVSPLLGKCPYLSSKIGGYTTNYGRKRGSSAERAAPREQFERCPRRLKRRARRPHSQGVRPAGTQERVKLCWWDRGRDAPARQESCPSGRASGGASPLKRVMQILSLAPAGLAGRALTRPPYQVRGRLCGPPAPTGRG